MTCELWSNRDTKIKKIIGIEEDIEVFNGWLKRFEFFIPSATSGRQKGLFKSFSGFNKDHGFCAQFVYGSNYEIVLSNNDIDRVLKTGTYEEKVLSAVDMFADNIQFLSDIKIVML